MEKYINKFPRAVLYFVGFSLIFTVVLIASELIFVKRHGQKYLYPYYLKLTQTFAQKNWTRQSIYFLTRSAETKLEESVDDYPDLQLSKKLQPFRFPNNQEFDNEALEILKNIDYENLSNGYASLYGKIFYKLGLVAYRENEFELAESLFSSATQLAPEWSYVHLELSNYYLVSGNVDKAKKQLDQCLLFKYPKDECLRYIENNLNTGTSNAVGTWEKQVESIQ